MAVGSAQQNKTMADTRRTLAALNSIMADNTSGNISPQDIRDMMLSLAPVYGGVKMNANATATTISASSTPTVSNWDSNGVQTNVREFSTTTGGRITYTGTPDVHVHCVVNASVFVTINASKSLEIDLYKNGTTAAGAPQILTTQGNSDHESVSIHGDAMLSNGDYLELFVANNTDSNNITVEEAYLFAMGMLV